MLNFAAFGPPYCKSMFILNFSIPHSNSWSSTVVPPLGMHVHPTTGDRIFMHRGSPNIQLQSSHAASNDESDSFRWRNSSSFRWNQGARHMLKGAAQWSLHSESFTRASRTQGSHAKFTSEVDHMWLQGAHQKYKIPHILNTKLKTSRLFFLLFCSCWGSSLKKVEDIEAILHTFL